jgi:hypothetical protein
LQPTWRKFMKAWSYCLERLSMTNLSRSGDLKVAVLLLGMHLGYIKYCCFLCKGATKLPSERTRGGLTTFYCPGFSEVCLSHGLFTQWFFFSRLSQTHSKQQFVVYPICIPSNSATTFREQHDLHLNSSYVIFPNSSFMSP